MKAVFPPNSLIAMADSVSRRVEFVCITYKIAAAMQTLPHGSLQEWVEKAYDDVHPRLWPVAARSLQAHVDHIREQTLS